MLEPATGLSAGGNPTCWAVGPGGWGGRCPPRQAPWPQPLSPGCPCPRAPSGLRTPVPANCRVSGALTCWPAPPSVSEGRGWLGPLVWAGPLPAPRDVSHRARSLRAGDMGRRPCDREVGSLAVTGVTGRSSPPRSGSGTKAAVRRLSPDAWALWVDATFWLTLQFGTVSPDGTRR